MQTKFISLLQRGQYHLRLLVIFFNEIFLLPSCLESTHFLDFYIHFIIKMKYNFFWTYFKEPCQCSQVTAINYTWKYLPSLLPWIRDSSFPYSGNCSNCCSINTRELFRVGLGKHVNVPRLVNFKKPLESPHSKGIVAEVIEALLYLSSAISYL